MARLESKMRRNLSQLNGSPWLIPLISLLIDHYSLMPDLRTTSIFLSYTRLVNASVCLSIKTTSWRAPRATRMCVLSVFACLCQSPCLTRKRPPKICSRRHSQILPLFQKRQIRHDISCESSAGRRF